MDPHKPPLSNTSQPPEALISAIRKVLHPLVRLLLSFQITLPFVHELIKSIYVEVADKHFRLKDKAQTDARISLLTGVHRKDVKRLREQEAYNHHSPASVGVGVQLVANWITQPDYLDADGQPRRLALKAEDDDTPDFEHLVQSVCKKDVRGRVVLDEWLRLGIVTLIDEHWVELNQQAFIPNTGLDEKAFYLGMNIADHLAAASDNLTGTQPPWLERCVYYDGLNREDVAELQAIAEADGMALLQKLNKRAMELKQQRTDDEAASRQRINVGLYLYSEEQERKREND